eukprot:10348009-Alexandrium_andersonii.AAC.1
MNCGATGRNAGGATMGGDGAGGIVPATHPVPWQGRKGVTPGAIGLGAALTAAAVTATPG